MGEEIHFEAPLLAFSPTKLRFGRHTMPVPVTVCYYPSVDRFHLQLNDRLNALTELEETLFACFQEFEPLWNDTEILLETFCCFVRFVDWDCDYTKSNTVIRAKIISIRLFEETAIVLLIDWATFERVDLKCLRKLPDEFSAIEPFALECCLENSLPFMAHNPELNAKFQPNRLYSSEHVAANFISRNQDGVFQVALQLKGVQIDLGLGPIPKFATFPNTTFSNVVHSKQVFEAVVLDVHSPNEISIMELGQFYKYPICAESLSKLWSNGAEEDLLHFSWSEVQPGLCCLAKNDEAGSKEAERYHRVQVESVDRGFFGDAEKSEPEALCYFVDKGVRHRVWCRDLLRHSEGHAFLERMPLTFRAILKDLEISTQISKRELWQMGDHFVALLKRILVSTLTSEDSPKVFECQILSDFEPFEISLTTVDGVKISQLILEQHYPIFERSISDAKDDDGFAEEFPEQLKPNTTNQVTITSYSSCDCFYVLPCLSKPTLDAITIVLTREYSRRGAEIPPVRLEFVHGTPCAFRKESSGNWYRAKVAETGALKNHILPNDMKIRLVDTGEEIFCSRKAAKSLLTKFAKVPPLAYRCKMELEWARFKNRVDVDISAACRRLLSPKSGRQLLCRFDSLSEAMPALPRWSVVLSDCAAYSLDEKLSEGTEKPPAHDWLRDRLQRQEEAQEALGHFDDAEEDVII